MTRITIILNDEESDALRILAEKELRGFRDQARFILRDGLIRQGALSVTIYNPAPITQKGTAHD